MVCHFCARQLGRVEPGRFRKAISFVARFLAHKWSDFFQSIRLAMISVAMDGGVEAGHLFQWMAAGWWCHYGQQRRPTRGTVGIGSESQLLLSCLLVCYGIFRIIAYIGFVGIAELQEIKFVHLKIDDYIRFPHDDRPLSSDVPDALKQDVNIFWPYRFWMCQHLALQVKSQEENKKQRWEQTKTKENRWEQMRTQDAKKWRFAISPFRVSFLGAAGSPLQTSWRCRIVQPGGLSTGGTPRDPVWPIRDGRRNGTRRIRSNQVEQGCFLSVLRFAKKRYRDVLVLKVHVYRCRYVAFLLDIFHPDPKGTSPSQNTWVEQKEDVSGKRM